MAVAATSTVFRDVSTPFAMAHRGGATYAPNAGIENTLRAFATAWELGHRVFETDVRASSDGVAVVVHDWRLDRLCGLPVTVADLTWDELSRLRVDAREPLPRLADLLTAFPGARLNIDVKDDSAVVPTLRAVAAAGAGHRVCLATFSDHRMRRIRRLAGPGIATSCSSLEVAMLRFGPTGWVRGMAARRGVVAAQVPWRTRGITIVNAAFVRDAHLLGLQVHVWTVDDLEAMRTLLDYGVDALITDRIDLVDCALTGVRPTA
ncbi:MAG: glycerophosphodiester phosphodiesterase [Actinomycetota bacterium]|nr:glycerophosphodiester phosphodiesterase [Actinomycetota bacterium]